MKIEISSASDLCTSSRLGEDEDEGWRIRRKEYDEKKEEVGDKNKQKQKTKIKKKKKMVTMQNKNKKQSEKKKRTMHGGRVFTRKIFMKLSN